MIQRETSASAQPRTPDAPVGPVRTCIGCRKRELAVELLRVVAVGNVDGAGNGLSAVAVDPARRLPGRGAWLHPTPRCLEAAVRRRAFGRALRITGSPDVSAVITHVNAVSGGGQDHPATRTGSEEHEHTVKSR
ncbi:YlxR family protein [Mycolicibacterium phlei]|uniref:YlxR family protein n=1 Tax=Mycolicibacterium phlei TaxID=1771 RepID=UPI0009D98014|nr:YlxR family protein [Mycolicibacterium phlei]